MIKEITPELMNVLEKEPENNPQTALIEAVKKEGVELATSQQIQNSFSPFFSEFEELKNKASVINVTSENQKTDMQMARVLRLALRDIRLRSDKKRKELKEDSLRYGKAVQGVYNVLEYMIAPIERNLEEQEKFAEIQAEKRKNELRIARTEKAREFDEFMPIGIDYSDMSEEKFSEMLATAKKMTDEKIAYEKKLEEERLEKIKREAEEKRKLEEENARIKAENERLETERLETEKRLAKEKAEREAKEAKEKAEREAKAKAEREANEAKIKAEREANEKRIKAEREANEKRIAEERAKRIESERKQKAEREELEAKMNAEREAREKAERERLEAERIETEKRLAKEKAEREAKEKAEREAREEEERKAKEIPKSDFAILQDFALYIQDYGFPEVKSKAANERIANAIIELGKIAEMLTMKVE